MSITSPPINKCFIPFVGSIDQYSLPIEFTYPFSYEPHPLCSLAAIELQQFLEKQTKWEHNFGLGENIKSPPIGKMFGILVVRNKNGQLGYLRAFSGDLFGNNNTTTFVPPVNNPEKTSQIYELAKTEVAEINSRIEELEKNPDTIELEKLLRDLEQRSSLELCKYKETMRLDKKSRKDIRESKKQSISPEDFKKLCEQLAKESCQNKFHFKHLKEHWLKKISDSEENLNIAQKELTCLNKRRRDILSGLQELVLNQYQFLNILGELKGIDGIFMEEDTLKAPAGSGNCAAPKLLQYAFKNELIPLAMAEFWWGASPKSAVRNHTHFYPSCKSRCRPILGHMLKGMRVAPNPLLQNAGASTKIEIIHEDEELLVINKPSGLLSVPGKTILDSVATRLKKRYPFCTGPLIVHRLDQCTSGIMLIAKSKKSYDHLQQQFVKRTIKKSYIAQLNGKVDKDKGIIDLPLRVDLDNRPYQLVCYEHGKSAITHYKVLKRDGSKTRIQFTPITGRTHQLRVHSAHVKGLHAPIVGDTLYGTRAGRLHLHANWIKFIHPISEEDISFEVLPPF